MNGTACVEVVDPPPPVLVTDAARRHLCQRVRAAGAAGIRLGVKESGCTGYMYELELAPSAPAGGLAIDLGEGAVLYVDDAAVPVLRGTTIDYVREGLNSSLKYLNPNAQDYCGCGESFSVTAGQD